MWRLAICTNCLIVIYDQGLFTAQKYCFFLIPFLSIHFDFLILMFLDKDGAWTIIYFHVQLWGLCFSVLRNDYCVCTEDQTFGYNPEHKWFCHYCSLLGASIVLEANKMNFSFFCKPVIQNMLCKYSSIIMCLQTVLFWKPLLQFKYYWYCK